MSEEKGDPFQIELRGYEVSRLTGGRWVDVSRWRPTEYGLGQAVVAAAWLNDRHPDEIYTVRPIVSMLPPQPVPPAEKDELHLEADEDPGPPGDRFDETGNYTPEQLEALIKETTGNPAFNKFRQTADEVPEE